MDATTYNQDNKADLNFNCAMIGITKETFYNFEIEDEGNYQHKQWKVREIKELIRRKKRSILAFCHSDEISSMQSNSRRIIDIKNGDTIENHVGRV